MQPPGARHAPVKQGCVKGEIAEAYGARRVVKLVDVLALPEDELPSAERVRCLHMFTPLLSNQVCIQGPAGGRSPARGRGRCGMYPLSSSI